MRFFNWRKKSAIHRFLLYRMSRSLEANRHSSDERNRTGVTEFRSSPQKTNRQREHTRGYAEKLLSTDWKRNVTDGRTRVASRTIRRKAVAFAGGGLSDARLGSRSGRRRSRGMATTQPLRRKWH